MLILKLYKVFISNSINKDKEKVKLQYKYIINDYVKINFYHFFYFFSELLNF